VTEWIARTPDLVRGQLEQTYARHIKGVVAYVRRFLSSLEKVFDGERMRQLEGVLFFASYFHDLGKLDDKNQAVLKGEKRSNSLPVHHQDAGVIYSLQVERILAATLIYSHHLGLPDFVAESNRGVNYFRDSRDRQYVDEMLPLVTARHQEVFGRNRCFPEESRISNPQVYLRIALSCLVDADHTDSSRPNMPLAEIVKDGVPSLRPAERLSALDNYVSGLSSNNERSRLRGEVYRACRDTELNSSVVACDSPVGTGKTTAVMANLLSVAAKRNLRRVFVVLPFTNIINQSVEVYRNAIVLPGEDPDSIVAAVHHQVDYEDESSRELSVRWDAPIVVTTAVAFFETLASARPSALRRLHQLMGSAVFVDEAHAVLPARLLPIAWRWIKVFADEWSVYWVLASGSLVRFWNLPEVDQCCRMVPELLPDTVRAECQKLEKVRVKYRFVPNRISPEELLERVSLAEGPRLIILNTVQTAAVVASLFAESKRFACVYHLSTALSPADRERTMVAVKRSLENDPGGNWVLVGTSCVEAGLDFSFSTGFREVASLVSLLQSAGRVNRGATVRDCEVFSFEFSDDVRLTTNPGLDDSRQVLLRKLKAGVEISPSLCTDALRQELMLNPGSDSLMNKVITAEENSSFPLVEKLFRVIEADTRTVVVDPEIVERLENFEAVDWREVQRNSVQLWARRIEKLVVPEV